MVELTKPQKEIQKAAREFAKGEFDKDLAPMLEARGEFPAAIWQKAADLGFIGLHYPETCSGGGLGLLEQALVIEEWCRNDPSIGGALAQASSGSECLLRFGSEALAARFLPEIAEGRLLSAKAFSESDRGGDYTMIETTAVAEGRNWKITGRKSHVLNGGEAGFYLVLCKTGQDSDPVGKRLGIFLVEADRVGIRSTPNGKRLGNNLVASAELAFNGVTIPEDHLLGKIGQGYQHLLVFLNEERVMIAAQALGTALACYDRMLSYVKGREQFGRKLAEFQVTRHKIAEMATHIELSRLILHKAASSIDHDRPDSSVCAMAKMTATRTAVEAGAQAIQLFGGYGYMTEYEVERFYREAKTLEVREGPRDVQKDTIANAVIGKIK